MYVTAT